jgi:hypothetical protein
MRREESTHSRATSAAVSWVAVCVRTVPFAVNDRLARHSSCADVSEHSRHRTDALRLGRANRSPFLLTMADLRALVRIEGILRPGRRSVRFVGGSADEPLQPRVGLVNVDPRGLEVIHAP